MLTHQPSRLLLVKSPFLLVRFVIFCEQRNSSPVAITHVPTLALLVYLGLTAMGFAAWEVGANRAAGAHGEPRVLSLPLRIAQNAGPY